MKTLNSFSTQIGCNAKCIPFSFNPVHKQEAGEKKNAEIEERIGVLLLDNSMPSVERWYILWPSLVIRQSF